MTTPGTPRPADRLAGPPAGLRRLLRSAAERPAEERCELCAQPLDGPHRHLVDTEQRSLRCACTACALLFDHQGAARGRYRLVGDRYVYAPPPALPAGSWDSLQIPVELAFFFHNSSLDQPVAFYPSPAGATESQLPTATWEDILAANPDMADVQPDTEALLVRGTDRGLEAYLVPIDACYELTGLVRLHWKGFDGGPDAHAAIGRFFAGLRARSKPARGGGGNGTGSRQ